MKMTMLIWKIHEIYQKTLDFWPTNPEPMHRLQVDFVVHVKACALYSDETTQGSKLSFTSAEAWPWGILKHQDGVLTMASPSKMFFNRKNMGLGRNMEFFACNILVLKDQHLRNDFLQMSPSCGFVPKLGYVPNAVHVWDRLPGKFNNPKLGSNLPEIWFWFIPAHELSHPRGGRRIGVLSSHGILVPQSAGESQFSPIKIAIWGGNTWNTWFSDTVIFPRSRKTSMAKKNTK